MNHDPRQMSPVLPNDQNDTDTKPAVTRGVFRAIDLITFLIAVAVVALSMLVMPRFVAMFEEMQVPLPPATVLVIRFSKFSWALLPVSALAILAASNTRSKDNADSGALSIVVLLAHLLLLGLCVVAFYMPLSIVMASVK